MERLAYKKVNVKNDQESSIAAVVRKLKEAWAGETIIEKAPKGEKASNGEAERAVQSIHGLARTLKEYVEIHARIKLDPRSPVIAWLIEHASNLHYIYNRGEDGMTPFQRVKGKVWQVPLPAFGESVEFKKRIRHKLEARWERGLFLSVKVESTEKVAGTDRGVFVVQSLRRLPEDQRYDSEALSKLKGLPWKPMPDGSDDQEALELPGAAELLPDSPEVPKVPTEAAEQTQGVRKYYITSADLDKYGRTEGCPAYLAGALKMPRQGLLRTPECRQRIEAAVASNPDRSSRLIAQRAREAEKRASEEAPASAPQGAGRRVAARTSLADEATGAASASSQQPLAPREAQPAEGAASESSQQPPVPREGRAAEGVASAPSHPPPMHVDSNRGRKRGDPPAGGDGQEAMEEDTIAMMARLIDHGGQDNEIEGAICALVESQRERVIMSVPDSGDECPVPVEQPFEWDDGDFVGPEDLVCRDDLSGKVLPGDLIQEARMEEIAVIDKIGLEEVVPRPAGHKVIGARWVDVNKGDEVDYQVRSRFVAKEIRHKGSVEQYFAAMPPLASLKMLLSIAVTAVLPGKEVVYAKKGQYVLQFLDVKTAHF